MRLLPVRSGHIISLTYAADGTQLAARAEPWGRLWLWGLRVGQACLLKEQQNTGPVAFSPDGTLLAIGVERQVGLRDLTTDVERVCLPVGQHVPSCLAFTPDGRTIVSAGRDFPGATQVPFPCCRLWDVTSGRAQVLRAPLGALTVPIALASDASLVLWGDPPPRHAPAQLLLWHVAARMKVAWFRLAVLPKVVAFDRARTRLAVGAGDVVLLYDIRAAVAHIEAELNGTPWAPLTLPLRRPLVALRLPPVGPPRPLEGHVGTVEALAFSADGRWLFSGGRDRTVRRWDVETGRETATWDFGIGVVYSLAVAPDGMTAVAGGNAGRTLVWDLDE